MERTHKFDKLSFGRTDCMFYRRNFERIKVYYSREKFDETLVICQIFQNFCSISMTTLQTAHYCSACNIIVVMV